MMKRIISLFAALMALLILTIPVLAADDSYTNSETGFRAEYVDDAGLIDAQGRQQIIDSMKPITQYGHVMFVTTDNNSSSTKTYAENIGVQTFGAENDFLVFIIDMDNREIYIAASRGMHKKITDSKADTITDNVYGYASRSDYTGCAVNAFNQMVTVIEGGIVPAPMKIIGCALIALMIGLTVCFMILSKMAKTRIATAKEIEKGMDEDIVEITGITRTLVSSHIVRASSGGSGGRSGGGGGFSGGGGGFSGGGGGHRF